MAFPLSDFVLDSIEHQIIQAFYAQSALADWG